MKEITEADIQAELEKVRTTEQGTEVVLPEARNITEQIMVTVRGANWEIGESGVVMERQACALRVAKQITLALQSERARAALVLEGFRERSTQRYKEHKEETEIRLACACSVIEDKYGGDSEVWKDVHKAFCEPSPLKDKEISK